MNYVNQIYLIIGFSNYWSNLLIKSYTKIGPRVHVNTLTSPIDANFVYGSTEAVALRLRSFKGGQFFIYFQFPTILKQYYLLVIIQLI